MLGDAFVFCYIDNAFCFVFVSCFLFVCFHLKTSITDLLLFSPSFELMDMYTGCFEFVCMGCENLAPYCTSTAKECLDCHASPSEVDPLLPCPTVAVIGWRLSKLDTGYGTGPSKPTLQQPETGCEPSLFCTARVGALSGPNSKHWFTTSFLQPLPYLVTP